MKLVSKAEPADARLRTAFPAFGSSNGDSGYGVERELVPGSSHLAPCRHCGVLNGRSASVCWSCEAALSPAPPPGATAAARGAPGLAVAAPAPASRSASPAFPSPVQAPAKAQAQFPVLTSIVVVDRPTAALSATAAVAPRRTLAVAAMLVVTAVLGAGAYLLLRPLPLVPLDLNPSAGRAAPAERLAADTEVLPAAVAPQAAIAVPVPAPEAPDDAIDSNTAAQVGAAPPPALAPPDGGAAPATRKSKSAESAPAARALPNRGGAAPGPQMPRPVGPCTPTVAALGLCTASPIPLKE